MMLGSIRVNSAAHDSFWEKYDNPIRKLLNVAETIGGMFYSSIRSVSTVGFTVSRISL